MNFFGLEYQRAYLFLKTARNVLPSLGRNILKLDPSMVFLDLNVLSEPEIPWIVLFKPAQPSLAKKEGWKGSEERNQVEKRRKEEGK